MESEQMMTMVGLIDHHAHEEDHDDFLMAQEIVIQLPRDRAFSWDVQLENDLSGELLAQRAMEAYEKSQALPLPSSLMVKEEKQRTSSEDAILACIAKSDADDISDLFTHMEQILQQEYVQPQQSTVEIAPANGKPPLGNKSTVPTVTGGVNKPAPSSSGTGNTTVNSAGIASSAASAAAAAAAKKAATTSDLLKQFDNSTSIYLRHDLNQQRSQSSNTTSNSSSMPTATSSSSALGTTNNITSATGSSGLSLSLAGEFVKRSPHMVNLHTHSSSGTMDHTLSHNPHTQSSLSASSIANIMNGLPPHSTYHRPLSTHTQGSSATSAGAMHKPRPYLPYGDATSSTAMRVSSGLVEASPYMITGASSSSSATSSASLGMLGGLERRVGAYTIEERKIKIEKFRERKRQRQWKKQIKYDCRKRLADTRPRVKGRFVSRKNLTSTGEGEAGMSPETKEFHDAIMDMPDGSDEEGSMGSARHGASLSMSGLVPPGLGPSHLSLQSLPSMQSLQSTSLSRMQSMHSVQSMQSISSVPSIHMQTMPNVNMLSMNSLSTMPSMHELQSMQSVSTHSAPPAPMVTLESSDLDLEMTLPNNFLDIEALLGPPQDGMSFQ